MGPVYRAVSLFMSQRWSRYQIILLGDRGICLWTTCLKSLPGSVPVWSRTYASELSQDYKSDTLPLDYRATPSLVTGTKLYCSVNWWTETHVCVQLAQGCYLAVHQAKVEPATTRWPVRQATTTPLSHLLSKQYKTNSIHHVAKICYWPTFTNFLMYYQPISKHST